MLLSIDRVLQLLSEGKSVEKISELASCEVEDVLNIIKEARELLARYEKPASKKKIIIKKKKDEQTSATDDDDIKRLLAGAELSAVPMSSQLTFYVAGESAARTKHAGIGIVINDREDRQVGKVSMYIGKADLNSAIYIGIIRALRIAEYFNTGSLRVRINSETLFKHLQGEITIDNERVARLRDEVREMMRKFKDCRMETISKNQNDKAIFLAARSVRQLDS